MQGAISSSANILPSYSTPDINTSLSSELAFVQSTSLPSMSDMTSSTSRSSTSLCSGSTSSLSSFSSSVSANQLQGFQYGPPETHAFQPWKGEKPLDGRDIRSSHNHPVDAAIEDPLPPFLGLRKGLRPQAIVSFLYRSLPHSMWDRLVLVVFFAYVLVLFKALAGYGGSHPNNSTGNTQTPSVPMVNSESISQTQNIAFLNVTQSIPNLPAGHLDESSALRNITIVQDTVTVDVAESLPSDSLQKPLPHAIATVLHPDSNATISIADGDPTDHLSHLNEDIRAV